MSAQHTPKVLKVVFYERACHYEGQERDGWSITGLDMVPDHEHPMFKEEDARRLVACWNACDGLPTDLLEDDSIMKIEGRIRRERDELLEALRKATDALAGGLWDYGPGQDEHDQCDQVVDECRAAIAKATGGEV